MTLQWTTVQPTEPGYYWARWKDAPGFTIVKLDEDGCTVLGRVDYYSPDHFDLWAWPVELPPAPLRPEPAKD